MTKLTRFNRDDKIPFVHYDRLNSEHFTMYMHWVLGGGSWQV